jgi:hypothetical protein
MSRPYTTLSSPRQQPGTFYSVDRLHAARQIGGQKASKKAVDGIATWRVTQVRRVNQADHPLEPGIYPWSGWAGGQSVYYEVPYFVLHLIAMAC